ncbi:MAG: VIT domain-containing protein [Anaerolineales bacterium]|nr:VIT domain-containing protein [Anaerolineales bacterium]
MKRTLLTTIFILLTSALILPTPARADGIIICDPGPCPGPYPLTPLTIKYHHVTVTIKDQIAVTHVDQVFYNPGDMTVEGTYIFPLPADAAVTDFILWIDGKPVTGQVLDAAQARQTYEDIVRNMRDPALLEYAGRGAVQARIFPIPPRGERRVELEYSQVLTADHGLVRYVYPLNTEKFSTQPLESVTVNVDIRLSSTPIRAVYSPTHKIAIRRADDRHVTAGYEAANVTPNTDFALYYSLGESEAFHLLTYRDPTDPPDPDGFFLLLLAPRPNAAAQVLPKDILLVLDHSGSMEGEKFQQAQEALRYILQHLNPEDRFNIVTFSTGVETYAHNLRPADEANEAIAWVNRLNAVGSTDINRALLEAAALTDRERPTYLIFLTDGLPTEGETDSQHILDNLASATPRNLRLFAFGVGYDVDTFLLDSLAQDHHGASTYIQPGEQLDEILSAFYARISTPVLTDLELDFNGIATYDLYPSPLPDLFSGSQIIVVGRYRAGGTATVTLTGMVNGKKQTFRYPEQAFTRQSTILDQQSAIPRLWATRKIGHLLNQVRLNGPDRETIDQIVKLSIRYGIVTPYTSYLVTEDMPLGAAEQHRIANEQYSQMATAPAAPAFGAPAVQKASDQGALAGAESAAAPSAEAAEVVKIVGSRTFVLSEGVWVDTAFDPDTMQTTKVAFISDDYFALADSRPELAGAFALGLRVIALSDSVAYEVVDSDTPTEPIQIPPTITPGTHTSPTTPGTSSPNSSAPCAASILPLLLLSVVLVIRRYPKK